MYKKLECSLYVFLILGWFVGSQGLVIYLLKLFFQMNEVLFIETYNHNMYKINLLIQAVCFIGLFSVHLIKKEYRLKEHNTFKKNKIMIYIFYGIGLWFLSSLLNILLISVFPDYPMQVQALFSNTERISRFMVIVIVAPLLEEYVFRSKIQNQFKQVFGNKSAIILQGALFGIIHPLPLQKIYATLLGIAFGTIKEKEQNLQSVIIIHMTINFIGFIIGTLSIS